MDVGEWPQWTTPGGSWIRGYARGGDGSVCEELATETISRLSERSSVLPRLGPPGLIRIGQSWVTQGFAGRWLDWHDSHKINWSKWGVVLALVVALAGLVRWLVG
jgi:hypothetical protein